MTIDSKTIVNLIFDQEKLDAYNEENGDTLTKELAQKRIQHDYEKALFDLQELLEETIHTWERNEAMCSNYNTMDGDIVSNSFFAKMVAVSALSLLER